MAADIKKAKKSALMELIKHVNKKRFQDRAMDTKAALKEVSKKKEDEEEDETLEEMEGRENSKKSEDKEERDEEERYGEKEFDDYRKSFMKRGARLKPSSSSVSVISKNISKNAPQLTKKGRGKRG